MLKWLYHLARGAGSTPGPAAAAAQGSLRKTPYGYLARDGADVSGIDYSQSFSVEIAVNVPLAAHRGYFNELIRHGAASNGFASVVGWTLGYSYDGYGAVGSSSLTMRICDGTNAVEVYPSFIGQAHVVCTYNASTKTLTPYVNGVAANAYANASLALSTISGNLSIGGYNLAACGTDPNESSFSSGRVATSEFRLYYARIWQKVLSAAEVSAISSQWNGSGLTTIPGTVVGTPVSAWYCYEEVGNKTGGAGTGWVKDAVGSNHLKIVSTNTYTGASGTAPALNTVKASTVAIGGVTDGASSVATNLTLVADGLYGSAGAANYLIEVDEVNTFDSAAYRSSGWLLMDGEWAPGFKPSTTYYARCKVRNAAATGEVSSWSPTVSFTTRAAITRYARDLTTYNTYGTEDGTSYANAWNGLRHNGQQGGLDARKLARQADLRNLGPGDTLYLCGDWGLESSTDIVAQSNKPRFQAICGQGLSGTPIKVRLDDGTNPGKVYKFRKYTGSITWTSEGSGTYSTPTYDPAIFKYAATSASKPDMGSTPLTQSLLLNQGSGPLTGPGFYYAASKLYVRMPDDSNPGTNLWQLSGYFDINLRGSQHVELIGGEWYGISPQYDYWSYSLAPKNIRLDGAKFKYMDTQYLAAINVGYGCDNWTIINCEIGYCRNGIYSPNETQVGGQTNRVENNWIHHCGVTGWTDDDGHGIGIQSCENWTITGNLIEYTGTGIEQFTQGKNARNNVYTKNVIRNCTKHDVAFGAGIALTGGTTPLGMRTGTVIENNAIISTDAASIHTSTPDLLTIHKNLLMQPGRYAKGASYETWYWHCLQASHQVNGEGVSVDFQHNVCVSPYHHTDGGTVGRFLNGDLPTTGSSTVTIDYNTYWDGSPVDANTSVKFSHESIGSGSFNTWQAIGTVDQNSQFSNPDGGTLPAQFDAAVADFFCQGVVGDMDDDGDVDATDQTTLNNYAAGNGPRWAMQKLHTNFLAYGAY